MYSMYEQESPPALPAPTSAKEAGEKDEPLPLPAWLVRLYFLFPIVLYIPDAIFNYQVYSDGIAIPATENVVLAVSQVALWSFLSIGVVGMAYLLSVLAPWHWMLGHRLQAGFCGLGVLIATAITTWNSLAYRSQSFSDFPTDKWAYSLWPELQANQISITMILVAIAPPFWGLFWALVQPTENKRSLAHLQESHVERMMRLQQEADIKRLKAETNAKIREAQLRGMAQTAAAAREQAGVVAAQWRKKQDGKDAPGQAPTSPAPRTTALMDRSVVSRGGPIPVNAGVEAGVEAAPASGGPLPMLTPSGDWRSPVAQAQRIARAPSSASSSSPRVSPDASRASASSALPEPPARPASRRAASRAAGAPGQVAVQQTPVVTRAPRTAAPDVLVFQDSSSGEPDHSPAIRRHAGASI
jgi:hypothetical protein